MNASAFILIFSIIYMFSCGNASNQYDNPMHVYPKPRFPCGIGLRDKFTKMRALGNIWSGRKHKFAFDSDSMSTSPVSHQQQASFPPSNTIHLFSNSNLNEDFLPQQLSSGSTVDNYQYLSDNYMSSPSIAMEPYNSVSSEIHQPLHGRQLSRIIPNYSRYHINPQFEHDSFT